MSNPIINTNDLKRIFPDNRNGRKKRLMIKIGRFLLVFAALFLLYFFVVNNQALLDRFHYFWKSDVQKQDMAAQTVTPAPAPIPQESRLVISKIDVNAPIIWNVDPNNIDPALENGVAQYAGTALPGNIGNLFIFGHSSFYTWAAGNYKSVFANLDKLEKGDRLTVSYNGKNYLYEVASTEVVSPDNVSVLEQGNTKAISLMTCVPVGTNLRRLIVHGVQIN